MIEPGHPPIVRPVILRFAKSEVQLCGCGNAIRAGGTGFLEYSAHLLYNLHCLARMKAMPTISMFYGIIISMFFEIKEKHHQPHIHVRYQNHKASIAIEDGAMLAGELPPRQLRMVQV